MASENEDTLTYSGSDAEEKSNLECSICLDTPELKWTLPCKHSFCYLCIKGTIESTGNTCPLCRGFIPLDVYENAKMKDMGGSMDIENIDNRWLYSGRNNGWWVYSDSHNHIIEDAYKRYLQRELLGSEGDDFVVIHIYGKEYTINFTDMTQRSPVGDWRNVQRLSIEDLEDFEGLCKGVAGIQVDRS
jgi:E3 ubiquitin-protein ligase RNF146